MEGLRGIARLSAVVATASLPLAVAGCGGSQAQDAKEPSGRFPVEVAAASFPSPQRISQHTSMRIVVRNAGSKTIPQVAVTVGGKGRGSSTGTGAGAFAEAGPVDSLNSNLADPSRPVWIIDAGPNRNGKTEGQPARGQPNTAYVNTWSLGPLAPGGTASFIWHLTAVKPGHHTVTWQVAAGLNGKAVAELPGGGRPRGKFDIFIDPRPVQEAINGSGNKYRLPDRKAPSAR